MGKSSPPVKPILPMYYLQTAYNLISLKTFSQKDGAVLGNLPDAMGHLLFSWLPMNLDLLER